MKAFIFGALSALVMISTSHASTYDCSSKGRQEVFTLTTSKNQKTILVAMEDYSETGEKASLNEKYKARNPQWEGSKLYDFPGSDPFGADGSSSFLISKELLADAKTGFAQYRNNWETYTSITLLCKKTK